MRIGRIAVQAEVSVQTVRFYERRGLLKKPRRLASGYREYPPETIEIIRFIKNNQRSGFTLIEIKGILKALASGSPAALNRRKDIESKIEALEGQIQSLTSIRDHLKHCLNACQCGDGESPCPGSEVVARALIRS